MPPIEQPPARAALPPRTPRAPGHLHHRPAARGLGDTTRRQYLADQIGATTNDVNDWRDEALLLNLANFGPDEQALFTQAGIVGLERSAGLDMPTIRHRLERAARALGMEMPPDLSVEGWMEQAHTLREE